MNKCNLCPQNCGANRQINSGFCSSKNLKIARAGLHFFEEPPISYKNGSGTIFFCGCPLKCVFCQNYEVSRSDIGVDISINRLSEIIFDLEKQGAENINLVSSSQFAPEIIEALKIYRPKIPIVLNSSGYENIETLMMLAPYIDIYLPDLKFYSELVSSRYTKAPDYFKVASKAVLKMAEITNKTEIVDGKMLKGMICRHLIMPLSSNDSVEILKWFKDNIPPHIYFSLMAQYTPFGDIEKFPELNRKITQREYDKVYDKLIALDIKNFFIQERSSSSEKFIPDWDFNG